MVANIAPELAAAEFATHHNARTSGHRGRCERHGCCAVIQRQEAVEAIVLGDLPQHLHGVPCHQPASMTDDRRLGQTGRSRGEDVLRCIAGLHAFTPFHRHGSTILGHGQSLQVSAELTQQTRCSRTVFVRPVPVSQPRIQAFGLRKVIGTFLAHDHMGGIGHLQRMRQRLARDMRVDEGHHGPQLGHAKPGKEKCRAIFNGHGHHIALFHALIMQGTSHLVGSLIELRVGIAHIAFDQEDALAKVSCTVLQTVGHGVGRLDHVLGRDGSAAIQLELGLLARHHSCVTHHMSPLSLLCV